MKKLLLPAFVVCMLQMVWTEGTAQARPVRIAPMAITIDGNDREWANYEFSSKSGIDYLVSFDKDYLYLVLKTGDSVLQGNILGGGIDWTIKMKDQTEASFTVSFPDKDQEDVYSFTDLMPEDVEIKTLSSRYGKIRVKGFDKIKEEMLTVKNPFGIRVSIGYQSNGYLVYEEAVPLSHLSENPGRPARIFASTILVHGLEKKITLVGGKILAPYKVDSYTDDPYGVLNTQQHVEGLLYEGKNKFIATGIRLTAPIEIRDVFEMAVQP